MVETPLVPVHDLGRPPFRLADQDHDPPLVAGGRGLQAVGDRIEVAERRAAELLALDVQLLAIDGGGKVRIGAERPQDEPTVVLGR